MKRHKTLHPPTKKAFAGSPLALASVLLVAGCAAGRGGGAPVRVMLPQPPSPEPVLPGPGTPRVHVTVEPTSALRAVELHQLVGLDLIPYSIHGRYGSASGTIETVVGRRVCAPPCEVVVDGRRGQEFFFTGPGISESSRFRLGREAGDVSFIVKPGRSTVQAVGVSLTGVALLAREHNQARVVSLAVIAGSSSPLTEDLEHPGGPVPVRRQKSRTLR